MLSPFSWKVHTFTLHIHPKEPNFPAKKLHFLAKEPYFVTGQLYVLLKVPYLIEYHMSTTFLEVVNFATYYGALHIHLKEPNFPPNSRLFYQKGPIFHEDSSTSTYLIKCHLSTTFLKGAHFAV